MSEKMKAPRINHWIHEPGWRSDMKLLDFMNLPYEQDVYEAMLPKITWREEQKKELLKKSIRKEPCK